MNPRVLMLIERYAPMVGGSETQCRLLAGALSKHGVAVSVLTRRIQPDMKPQESMDGIPVYRVGPPGFQRLWSELGFAYASAAALIRLRSTYDLVHLHSGTSLAGAAAVLVCRMLRKPAAVKVATAGDIVKGTIDTGDRQSAPSPIHRFVNSLINGMLRRADAMLCISQEIFDELRTNGFSPSRLHLLPNAVDTARFAPVSDAERLRQRDQLHLPAGKIVFLFTGRLIQRKGVDTLLNAWVAQPALRERGVLVLVGSGSTSMDNVEDRLRRMAAGTGGDSVIFAGERSNILSYVHAADVFVFPSRREGLSNSLLEAMSCGKPVIASAIGGTVDVITTGDNGILFPPDDEKALARHMLDLAAADDRRAALGTAARLTMERRYAISQLLPAYLRLYERLVHA